MIKRLATHLLLRPEDIRASHPDWEVIGVFNPGVARVGDETIILARVAERPREERKGWTAHPRWSPDAGYVIDWVENECLHCDDPRVTRHRETGLVRLTFISHLRVVRSRDGRTIDNADGPSFLPANEMEEFGLEDPRITFLDGRYYITYVAVSRHGPATALASTTDFKTFERRGVIFCPENKDVVLLPERVDGQYIALHRPVGDMKFSRPEMWIARSSDLIHWGSHRYMFGGAGDWEDGRVGAGAPPIATPDGWLEIYHGNRRPGIAGDVGAYCAGAMLLAKDEPGRVVKVSQEPILEPELEFENEGFVAKVVFPTGALEDDDRLLIYYGASDKYCAMAEVSRRDVMNEDSTHFQVRPMPSSVDIHKVAFVADYMPRKCGIATFTFDLRNAVASQYPDVECIVIPVDDIEGGYDYPTEVRFEIQEQELASYRRAADYLNFANVDVVCLQHEFGIYGGAAGGHVLALMRDLRVPVVSTLHTVLQTPNDDQLRVMQKLCELSSRVVVMSERSRNYLVDIYNVPEEKIDLILHGIPDMPFVDPNFFKDQFDVEGKFVALTFGLLSPNKGIEVVLNAMPKIIAQSPDFVYIILGATHPHLLRDQGETYRLSLERLAQRLNIKKHVIFYNRFVELRELTEFIGAADVYITPYLNAAQAVSGTLAYSFGCGKAVISTPYWHAEELLAEDRGILVPFGDSDAIARAVIDLQDDHKRNAMRKRAYLMGREMIWSHVAHLYMESFQRARISRPPALAKSRAVRTLDEEPSQLPEIRLQHLWQMTDPTGVIQHATFSIPNFHEGYCLDDNARALVLTVLLEELGDDSFEINRAATIYAAFLNYAFDLTTGAFRNFLSFDRKWLDVTGSDDSVGRAAWAVGACIGRTRRRTFHSWAAQLLEPAVNAVAKTTSPRAWAFALIGIHEYLRRMSGDRLMNQHRDTFTSRLVDLYERNATDDWPWFEQNVTYDNAKLPHALILSGRWTNNPQAMDIGLRTLRWLADVQRAPEGHFRPIGSEGFYVRGKQAAQYDQQPLEAQSMVSAAIEAYQATNDSYWLDQARLAFEWFTGRNDLGMPVCDPSSGACCDGLHADRVNQNQGAESTLAYLLALAEMQLLENSLTAFRKAAPATVG